MQVNVVAVLCCIVVCMATLCASSPPVLNCKCSKTSTTIEMITFNKLLSYSVQGGMCPIKAIRFKTVKGKFICSDPDSPWTKRAMEHLDSLSTPSAPTTTTVKTKGPTPSDPTCPVKTMSPTSSKPTVHSREPLPFTPTTISSAETKSPTPSKSTTSSTVTERGSTSSLPPTPTTLTTHQKTHTTSRLTMTAIDNNTAKGPSSTVPTPTTLTTHQKTNTTHRLTKTTINNNAMKGPSSAVTKRRTVLPTRKLPSWVERRANRRKKPGLRKKQKKVTI